MLGGCLGSSPKGATESLDAPAPDPVWDTRGNFSKPLHPGGLAVLPAERHEVAAHDGVVLVAYAWRPDLGASATVPVILDIGPYFGDGIGELGNGYDKQVLVDGFVTNGYAYGRVAVRGSSASGGCQDVFSPDEQKDVDTILTYFGTRPWSNGNVALIGVSYDGTTPWEGAASGNPHLKAIVPMEGIPNFFDLMYPNGTAWLNAPIMHALYWGLGFVGVQRSVEQQAANAACPDVARAIAIEAATAVTGEYRPAADPGFFAARDFRQRVKENYQGSVFLVHSLQDWRIPPNVVFPFVTELQAQGTPVKMLIGQWWHDVPDRASRLEHVRWDFAELLYQWFDKYLRNNTAADTGPVVSVEDDQGNWRTEPTWPPADLRWRTLYLGAGVLSDGPTTDGQLTLYDPANAHGVIDDKVRPVVDDFVEGRLAAVRAQDYVATLGRLDEALRLSGPMPLHITVVPRSPLGGRMYAELIEVGEYGRSRIIAHGAMDLRYYEGGYESHQLAPDQPILARMQMHPADLVVAAGHELVLRIVAGHGYTPTGDFTPGNAFKDHYIEHPAPVPVDLRWGGDASRLFLPVVERDIGDGRYPGQPG